MEEDLAIINSNTRNEKIKNFLIKNKNKFIVLIACIVIVLLSFFAYNEYKQRQKIKISNLFNSTIIEFSQNNKEKTQKILTEIVNMKDPTYSPLSLYFIIDNSLIANQESINELFDILIYETSLDKEIKNLIIYKKGLYNADNISEIELLNILNPLLNSDSIWKSHASFLVAEYFYSVNEMQKSKEFFNNIILLENANEDLKLEAQKRLRRDFSD